MRIMRFVLQKEFRQIFRDKNMLRMIFMIPIIQLLVLPQAANFTIKNINLAVVDHDHSSYSQKFISKILSSGYFKLAGYDASFNESYKLIEKDKADIVLEIPQGFEKNLIRENSQKLYVAVNAINGTKALVGSGYLNSIIMDYNNEIRLQWIHPDKFNPLPTIDIATSNWFNPNLTYYIFMVPGILVMLITLIGGNMSALNIVKEKEIGTIEQINVTPLKKYHFLLGKLIPFWIIGMVVFTIGLTIARLVYGIIPLGNIGLLYLFLAVYLFAILGFGLLISTYAETQQQAQSLTFFFVMIFNLMGGLFTPIDSMPEWAQWITRLIPISYFINVMRMVVLKGSGFSDIQYHLLIVFIMGLILNGWAILNYKKTS
jgi:ABC-2 type transport system permease protein